jgi:hypothetical protein
VKVSTQIVRKIEYHGRGAAYISIGKMFFTLIDTETKKCRPDFIRPFNTVDDWFPKRIKMSYTMYPEKRQILVHISMAIK